MLLAAEPGSLLLLIVVLAIAALATRRRQPTQSPVRLFAFVGALVAVGFMLLYHVRDTNVQRHVAEFQQQQAEAVAQAQREQARAMARASEEQARAMKRASEEQAKAMKRASAEQARAIRSMNEAQMPAIPPVPNLPVPPTGAAAAPVTYAAFVPAWGVFISILLVVGIGFGVAKALSLMPARSLVIGALVAMMGLLFLLIYGWTSVSQPPATVFTPGPPPAYATAAPAPPKPSAVAPKLPQPVILEALAKALQSVSSDPATAPTIILVATDGVRVLRNALSEQKLPPPSGKGTGDKGAAKSRTASSASQSSTSAKAPHPSPLPEAEGTLRPAWVDAAPRMEGDAYVMAKQVGPYTALPECERELPKVLEQAAAEYAELLLGREKAQDVHLPDDVLQGLVRQRWTERLTQEFGGAPQDMVVLHVQIAFDPLAQERIREAGEHALAVQRMRVAAAVLGGVICLLALVWCGLSVSCRSREAKPQPEAVASAPKTKWSLVAIIVAVLLAMLIAAMWFVASSEPMLRIKPEATKVTEVLALEGTRTQVQANGEVVVELPQPVTTHCSASGSFSFHQTKPSGSHQAQPKSSAKPAH